MERLLKIVEGPIKGAEIALVDGTRVRFGRDDSCDIVIADASLPDLAFELDVSESAVTLITPDGSTRELKNFEIHAFGTTSVAIGPTEGKWEELRPATVETEAEPDAASEKPESEGQPGAASENPAEEGGSEAPPEAPVSDDATPPEKRKHGCGCGCLVVLLLLLLLATAVVFAWVFRGKVKERWPSTAPTIEWVEKTWNAISPWYDRLTDEPPAQDPDKVARASLRDLAAQHGLSYEQKDGTPFIRGNLRRRTERLAVRALALAVERGCALDLSDDETLLSSAEALLFTVTEGAVKVAAATNRVVVLKGYAPDRIALGRALSALRNDVPWLTDVDTRPVQVGGPVPPELAGNAFALSGTLVPSEGLQAEVPAPVAEEKQEKPAVVAEVKTAKEVKDEPRKTEAVEKPVAVRPRGMLPREMFPVAGILTRPYPCVVLQDGQRLIEGGLLGEYTIVEIREDEIRLERNKVPAIWKPL